VVVILFRLATRGGSPTKPIREGDAFTLIEPESGHVVRAERCRAVAGPPEDIASPRFASLLVPRLGSVSKY
jgi:hypothetical protein